MAEESEAPGQRMLSSEELSRQLEKLLKEGSSNQRVFDWIEVGFSWEKLEGGIKERSSSWCVGREFMGHLFLFCTGQPE